MSNNSTIRCPNCKHPYFTVPIPKKDSGDGGLKKKKGMSIGQILALVVVGIGLAGTAIWWFVVRIPTGEPGKGPVVNGGNPGGSGGEVPPPPPPPTAAKRLTLEEIRSGATTDLNRVAGTNDTNQVLAIRYLAESYASAGQMEQAAAKVLTFIRECERGERGHASP